MLRYILDLIRTILGNLPQRDRTDPDTEGHLHPGAGGDLALPQRILHAGTGS